jgi:hypothetical protein
MNRLGLPIPTHQLELTRGRRGGRSRTYGGSLEPRNEIVAIYRLLEAGKGHLGPWNILLRVLELIVGQS